MAFKITVKDGDTDYKYNPKSGQYESKTMDAVNDYDTLAEAMAEFLYAIEDYGQPKENKVSLTYLPKKKGKKK